MMIINEMEKKEYKKPYWPDFLKKKAEMVFRRPSTTGSSSSSNLQDLVLYSKT